MIDEAWCVFMLIRVSMYDETIPAPKEHAIIVTKKKERKKIAIEIES